MYKYILGFIILLSVSTVNASKPTIEELKKMGEEAYANNNCLDAVKYLFAYLVVESELDTEKRKSAESAITYCESILAPVKDVAGWESGTMAIISSGGSIKPLNPGSGGVLVTTGGNLQTIDTSTGGVFITTEGVLSKPLQNIEYWYKNQSNPLFISDFIDVTKQRNDLDFLIKRKQIEIEALDGIRQLYSPPIDMRSLTNGSIGLPNASPLRSTPFGSQ